MLLLDTNVVSELRKVRAGKADRNVAKWADQVNSADLFISAITVLEIEHGVLLLERRDPKQGALLRQWLDNHVLPAFDGRILSVDAAVARQAATLHVPDPGPFRDTLIAATALVYRMPIVTRNEADFTISDLQTINPWN